MYKYICIYIFSESWMYVERSSKYYISWESTYSLISLTLLKYHLRSISTSFGFLESVMSAWQFCTLCTSTAEHPYSRDGHICRKNNTAALTHVLRSYSLCKHTNGLALGTNSSLSLKTGTTGCAFKRNSGGSTQSIILVPRRAKRS